MVQPLPQCGPVCFVEEMASTAVSVLSHGVGLTAIVLGGCVLWCVFLLTRWLLNGCTFRNKGGRRR